MQTNPRKLALLALIRPFRRWALTHLSQSQLHWSNPLIVKTRNQTSLQLFCF